MQAMVNSADIDAVEPVEVLGLRFEKMAHMCDAGVRSAFWPMTPGQVGIKPGLFSAAVMPLL